MTKATGCLWALGGVVAVGAAAGALLAPTVLREGRRVMKPVAEMKSAEREYKAFIAAHPWKDPPTITIEEAQLERFLALRREVRQFEGDLQSAVADSQARQKEPTLRDMPGIMAGVGEMVSGRLKAYVNAGMNPAEYRYLERVVYDTWRRGLIEAGTHPAAVARAAREIDQAAAGEKSAAMAARLRAIAADLRARDPGPPSSIPLEVHRLLMPRAEHIEALAETAESVAGGAGGPR